MKSSFLSNMSHEIRTPLNAILGFIGILIEEETDEEKLDKLSIIKDSGKSLMNIINEILDFSKIEAGKMDLILKRFSIKRLLNNLYKTFHRETSEKNIDFIVKIEENLPEYIFEDEFRINQIITNLLSNAIKFTKDGYIKLIAKRNGNQLILIVKDTGIGIKSEFLTDLFTPFKQINSGLKLNIGGTGLGLAITKSLVELLNGIITVSSEENIGTEFIVSIPLKKMYNDIDIKDADEMVKKWIKNMNFDSCCGEEIPEKINEDDDYAELILEAIYFIGEKIPLIKDKLTNKKWEDAKLLSHEIKGFTGNLRMEELYNPIKRIDELLLETDKNEDEIFHMFINFEEIYNIIPDKFKDFSSNKTLNISDGVSILLAEDNYINQMLLKKILKKLNLDCDIANNGEEALKMMSEKNYNILFLDLQMPVLDGRDVLRAMMKEKRYNKVYKIVLTALAIEETKDICQMLGADDFITKPIELDSLKKKLTKLLNIEK